MFSKRTFVHTVFLFAMPVFAAWFDWSVIGAVFVVLLMLLWRWLLSLSVFVVPKKAPPLVLESISASHFVEKVRWNLDVAGIDYEERASGGTLGAYFLGRTVPRLNIRTGAVRSNLGNSAEILRFLWGQYAVPNAGHIEHLQPTPERLELEKNLDRYGTSLQVWVYHHILDEKDLTLHAWGVNSNTVPRWQRWLMPLLYPVLALLVRKSFRITAANYERACESIEAIMQEVETRLADGRRSILGDDQLNYTDYQFAAMTGLWMQPENYGGGKASQARIERSRAPNPMRADIERWSEDYPRTVAWVQRLYAEDRI